jgi:predicted amidohydrolase YtcJ
VTNAAGSSEAGQRFWLLDVRRPGSDQRIDVAVDGGMITEIVDHGQRREPDRTLINADGRWIIPGLFDAHVHATHHAIQHSRIDVSAAGSAAEAVQLIAEALDRRSGPTPGEPVIAVRFQDALWPDRPDKRLLDDRFGDLPVILLSHDLHCGWAGTAALRLMGVDDHPTGLLTEGRWTEAWSRLPAPASERTDAMATEAIRAAAARGITGIQDFEFADNVSVWERRLAGGCPPIRVVCGIRYDDLTPEATRGLRQGDALPGTGGLITMGPVKVFVDGSLNTRTAYCHDGYPDGSRGELVLDHDGLIAIMEDAREYGLGMAVHAIGDHANTIALDCFERTRIGGRIEHAQLITDEDLGRFAELGVVASVQPWHAIDDWQVADHYWPNRTRRTFPLASLAQTGAVIEFGSDAPVAPLDPWRAIVAAVDRESQIGRPWHPEQQLSIAEALRFSTHGRQRVRPGEPADLVLLDDDPCAMPTADLINIGVHATAVAGRWVHGPDS